MVSILQQWIHDNLFVSGNIENVEGMHFEAAEVFPGLASSSAPNIDSADVEILATYNTDPGFFINQQS